jgi:hypothetical protein
MSEFQTIFDQLKHILTQIPGAVVTADKPGHYSLNTPYSIIYQKEVFLAAAVINKNYVSYHLMPVYAVPELLEEVSPELKRRMQGKSCFNFKKVDEPLFAELEALTLRGLERFREKGML